MTDYNTLKADYFRSWRPGHTITKRYALSRMNADQKKRMNATNFVTDDQWEYRRVADGALVLEISYGWMLNRPVFGLTVCCVGALAQDAEEWDHTLSDCYPTIPALIERMNELNKLGRDRVQAIQDMAAA